MERRFLRQALLSLGTAPTEPAGLREAARAVRRWDGALALARAGSVAESVWSALVRHGLQGELPGPARSAFEEAHQDATARNALLLTEAAAVQATLAAAGVDSIVLKGPGLLVAHYPDIGARHVADVDLLVRERDVARANDVVRAQGARDGPPAFHYDGTRAEQPDAGHVHSPVVQTASGIPIELHRAQPGEPRDGSGFEGLLARSRRVAWKGRALRIPSVADLAAGGCWHVFDHHDGGEKYLSRLLGDLAVTVGAGATTWEEVETCMAPAGGRRALVAARRLLEAGPAGGFEAWRHATRVRARHWRELFARQGRTPSRALRIIFPAPGYMANRYRVQLESPRLPLLYFWRPARGLWALLTGR